MPPPEALGPQIQGPLFVCLRVFRAARDGDVCHAAVEQVFRGQLGIDVNQHALGGLPLAGIARHRIAVIEMGMLARIELHVAASVHSYAEGPERSHRSKATDLIAFAVTRFFFCHFLPKNRMSSPQVT
jgi:hypothetical protein